MKTVDSFDEAVAHINHYNTGHSEAIVTDSYQNAQEFLNQIDAAAVYVNASTRCTDNQQIYYLWKWTDPQIIEYKSQNCKLFQNLKKI